jgi:Uma2 family endonuclease
MADAAQRRMTADEFLVWHLAQELKYELVDGIPVPHRAMAGGSAVHSAIAANILVRLSDKLRGSPCRPHGSDLAVRTSITQVRYPEVSVNCAPLVQDVYEATNPIAVLEVLSPSASRIDLQIKLIEYQRHPAIMTIVLIEPSVVDVIVHTRDATRDWQYVRLRSLEDTFAIQGGDARLSLAEIYEDIPFGPTAAAPAGSRALL